MSLGMSSWNPYSLGYYVDHPHREDPWGLFEPEPLDFWPESTMLVSPFGQRGLRSRNIGTPALQHSLQQRGREVVSDKDKFQVTLSVGDFKTNEVSVKVVDGCLVICAEHEEKPDDHGHVYRCIKRRYKLPGNADIENMNASLADNGTLIICAPKKQEEVGHERNIEIKHVSSPSEQTPETRSSEVEKSKKSEPTQTKGKVNIPVSHEALKK